MVNYAGNDCCFESQPINCETGVTIGGFDACLAFNEKGIGYEFARKNKRTLLLERAGLWLWKPYIIYRTLLAMNDGDYMLYLDSGAYFERNFESSVLCQMAKLDQDIAVFSVGLPEKEYTKEEAFQLLDCTSDECRNTPQRSGTFIMLRRNHRSLRFVSEWLTYAQDRRIITEDGSNSWIHFFGKKRVQHRHDQSILSLLSKKWNLGRLFALFLLVCLQFFFNFIDVWPDPSQFGDRPLGDDPHTEKIKSLPRFKVLQGKHFIQHTRDTRSEQEIIANELNSLAHMK